MRRWGVYLLIFAMVVAVVLEGGIQKDKAYANEEPTISVKLVQHLGNQTSVDIDIKGTYQVDGESYQLESNNNYRVRIESGSLALYSGSQRIKNYGSSFKVNPSQYGTNHYIEINGRRYLGSITFTIESGAIRPINTLLLEDYLKSVVPNEIYPSWHPEALKAQAVAARTFAMGSIDSTLTDAHQNAQEYGGYDWDDSDYDGTTRAVEETKGEVLEYKGELIDAFFHASNGGYTESNINVWNEGEGEPPPYLRAGNRDTYDQFNNQHYNWSVTLHKTQIDLSNRDRSNPGGWWNQVSERDSTLASNIQSWIKGQESGVSSNADVKIVSIPHLSLSSNRTSGQRRTTASIDVQFMVRNSNGNYQTDGSGNVRVHSRSYDLRASDLRLMLGAGEMKSLLVNQLRDNGASYTMTGDGFGHGVGMSQFGARGRAEAGHSYTDILQFYYPGTEITGSQPTEPIYSMRLTEVAHLYDAPNGRRSSSSVQPQTVNVFIEENGWYLIHTWQGPRWIQPQYPIKGEIRSISERITLTEDAHLHDAPFNERRRSSVVRPQTVTAFEEWNGWYHINTWQGPKWIQPNNPIMGEITEISKQLLVTEATYLHDQPFTSTRRSSMVQPQIVRATGEWGNWYRINTWQGSKWIDASHARSIEIEEVSRQAEVILPSYLHSHPLAGSRRSTMVQPQVVTVTGEWGDWYRINTWQGPMWIESATTMEEFSGQLNLTEVAFLHHSPSSSSRSSSAVQPQTVTATGKWKDWYRINTWRGQMWIYLEEISQSMALAQKDETQGIVQLNNTDSVLNVRSEPEVGDNEVGNLSHGTEVEIVNTEGNWYKIKHESVDGYGYIHRDYVETTFE